ncbi:MAG TPA: hypothetical protein VFO85_08040 [Vicinamibacteria bacterium]|nr:hypothetical protein [Vicinamibacteria bacterium]
MKRLLIGAGVLAVAGVGGFFGYMQLVKAGYVRYNQYDRRERGTLREGGPAADVALTSYDGSPVQLSSLWTRRPLFLVFGSCT